jgi:hypothetical protein
MIIIISSATLWRHHPRVVVASPIRVRCLGMIAPSLGRRAPSETAVIAVTGGGAVPAAGTAADLCQGLLRRVARQIGPFVEE